MSPSPRIFFAPLAERSSALRASSLPSIGSREPREWKSATAKTPVPGRASARWLIPERRRDRRLCRSQSCGTDPPFLEAPTTTIARTQTVAAPPAMAAFCLHSSFSMSSGQYSSHRSSSGGGIVGGVGGSGGGDGAASAFMKMTLLPPPKRKPPPSCSHVTFSSQPSKLPSFTRMRMHCSQPACGSPKMPSTGDSMPQPGL
mmetsp:Transcript_52155/g.168138  ORF Transcript_52155/g.168138 Transcript_52155/m.168138 type:complete len:201 (+) Transcript_52155:147-749(+)